MIFTCYRKYVCSWAIVVSRVIFCFQSVDDLIGRVIFDRESLAQSHKGLDKWFPLSAVDMYNYSDIQGEIRIEATLYEKANSVFCVFHKIKFESLLNRDS